jgi:hypothetical protein
LRWCRGTHNALQEGMATPTGAFTSVPNEQASISPELHYQYQPSEICGLDAPRGPYAKVVRCTSRRMMDKTDRRVACKARAQQGPFLAVWPGSSPQARRRCCLRLTLIRQPTPSHPDAGISSLPACVALVLSHHRRLLVASTTRKTPSRRRRQFQAHLLLSKLILGFSALFLADSCYSIIQCSRQHFSTHPIGYCGNHFC